jgi:hypothetical protein
MTLNLLNFPLIKITLTVVKKSPFYLSDLSSVSLHFCRSMIFASDFRSLTGAEGALSIQVYKRMRCNYGYTVHVKYTQFFCINVPCAVSYVSILSTVTVTVT